MKKQFILSFEGDKREIKSHVDEKDLQEMISGYYLEIFKIKLQEVI